MATTLRKTNVVVIGLGAAGGVACLPLAQAGINVDMIVQTVAADGQTTDLTFAVPAADYERAADVLARARKDIGYERLDGATDVAKVSVIGIGMRSHAGVAAKAFKALSTQKINILAITTSEIKFSVLIKAAQTDLAVRTLHTLYGLDRPRPVPFGLRPGAHRTLACPLHRPLAIA